MKFSSIITEARKYQKRSSESILYSNTPVSPLTEAKLKYRSWLLFYIFVSGSTTFFARGKEKYREFQVPVTFYENPLFLLGCLGR